MTDFTVDPPTVEEQAIMARQESLSLRLPEHGVAIVGCGGVGSWTALLLALAGVRNLWLFDYDLVSDHNLNRLPLPITAIGTPKSEAMAKMIASLRPSCKVAALGKWSPGFAERIRLSGEVDWLVPTTDTWDSRRECYDWAQQYGLRYIEASAEGEAGSIIAAPAEFATDDERKTGYAHVPVWVGPCIAAAQMAVAHIIHGAEPENELVVRLEWAGEMAFFNSMIAKRLREQAAAAAPPLGRGARYDRVVVDDGLEFAGMPTTPLRAGFDQLRTGNYIRTMHGDGIAPLIGDTPPPQRLTAHYVVDRRRTDGTWRPSLHRRVQGTFTTRVSAQNAIDSVHDGVTRRVREVIRVIEAPATPPAPETPPQEGVAAQTPEQPTAQDRARPVTDTDIPF